MTMLALFLALALDIRSASGWVGYSVPIADGRHTICSWDEHSINIDSQRSSGSSALLVMYRVEGGAIKAIRLSSPECRATHEVRWLQNVDPRDSIALLRELTAGDVSLAKKAVVALALHDGAEQELVTLARRHASPKVRGAALFWVGQRAGKRAAETLRDAVDNDPDREVKSKAVFGISQLPDEQSVPLLIELLKTNRSREVRKKAAFWLSQKDDPRALQAFEEILSQ